LNSNRGTVFSVTSMLRHYYQNGLEQWVEWIDFICVVVTVILECVSQWDCYYYFVKFHCQETASGDCSRLRILVSVCQWHVKCSHKLWVYKQSINPISNSKPCSESLSHDSILRQVVHIVITGREVVNM
jgi:hypothetical protein